MPGAWMNRGSTRPVRPGSLRGKVRPATTAKSPRAKAPHRVLVRPDHLGHRQEVAAEVGQVDAAEEPHRSAAARRHRGRRVARVRRVVLGFGHRRLGGTVATAGIGAVGSLGAGHDGLLCGGAGEAHRTAPRSHREAGVKRAAKRARVQRAEHPPPGPPGGHACLRVSARPARPCWPPASPSPWPAASSAPHPTGPDRRPSRWPGHRPPASC